MKEVRNVSKVKGIKGLPKLVKPGDLITKSNEAVSRGLNAVKSTSKTAVKIKALI